MSKLVDRQACYFDVRLYNGDVGILMDASIVDTTLQAATRAVIYRAEKTGTHPKKVLEACDTIIFVTYHFWGSSYKHPVQRDKLNRAVLRNFRSKVDSKNE